MWGWTSFAAGLALCWGALLRPGEFLAAIRKDLLLPTDVSSAVPYALLAIKDPKTRYTHSRHQAAKLDIPDLLELVCAVYGKLQTHQKLWPFSGQTMRQRLKSVMQSLSLPIDTYDGVKALDLGSLRSGGSTWILQVTDNGELVRRRGRWANQKMMEIYVQETASLLYMNYIPGEARYKVLSVAQSFPEVLQKAKQFLGADIPTRVWPILFSKWQMPWSKRVKRMGKSFHPGSIWLQLQHSSDSGDDQMFW